MRFGARGCGLSVFAACLVLALGVGLTAVGANRAPAASADPAVALGKSGLPLPRFVSLKSNRVNVRVGPGEDYNVAWVFTRSELPVEVIQEFDNWRRIRDSDGAVGWVFHSLLTGKRTAVVAPWADDGPRPIRASASQSAQVTAYLQPGVVTAIDGCGGGWCRLSGSGFRGWIEQVQLWGVYPGEDVD